MSRRVALTVRVSTDDIAGMREWLEEYGGNIPHKQQDVLWAYLCRQLLSNSESDCVSIRIDREARP